MHLSIYIVYIVTAVPPAVPLGCLSSLESDYERDIAKSDPFGRGTSKYVLYSGFALILLKGGRLVSYFSSVLRLVSFLSSCD